MHANSLLPLDIWAHLWSVQLSQCITRFQTINKKTRPSIVRKTWAVVVASNTSTSCFHCLSGSVTCRLSLIPTTITAGRAVLHNAIYSSGISRRMGCQWHVFTNDTIQILMLYYSTSDSGILKYLELSAQCRTDMFDMSKGIHNGTSDTRLWLNYALDHKITVTYHPMIICHDYRFF